MPDLEHHLIAFLPKNPAETPQGWKLFLSYISKNPTGILQKFEGMSKSGTDFFNKPRISEGYILTKKEYAINPDTQALFQDHKGNIYIANRSNHKEPLFIIHNVIKRGKVA